MKKCICCLKRFDDSLERCPQCNLVLIRDVAADWETPHTQAVSEAPVLPINNESNVPAESPAPAFPRRQGRTVVVEEPVSSEDTIAAPEAEPPRRESTASVHDANGFVPDSGETEPPPTVFGTPRQRTGSGMRRRNVRRNTQRILRLAVPILLIVAGVAIIVYYWDSIRTFLSVSFSGALVGALAALFLSRRSMNAFAPRILFTGALVGAVLSCMLTYRMLDVPGTLSTLFNSLGPLLIVGFGIYLAISTITRR